MNNYISEATSPILKPETCNIVIFSRSKNKSMKSIPLGYFVKNIIKQLTPDSFYNANTCNGTHPGRLLYQKVIPRVKVLLMVAMFALKRYELKNGKVSFLTGVVSRLSRPHFIPARGCGKA